MPEHQRCCTRFDLRDERRDELPYYNELSSGKSCAAHTCFGSIVP